MKKYSVRWFINKFTRIPAKRWTTGILEERGRSCALGHCGLRSYSVPTEESLALLKIFGGQDKRLPNGGIDFAPVYLINDNGERPRGNMLRALKRKLA